MYAASSSVDNSGKKIEKIDFDLTPKREDGCINNNVVGDGALRLNNEDLIKKIKIKG